MSPQSQISKPLPDPEVLVRVENVSKIFCRDLKKSLSYGFKDSVRDLVGGSRITVSALDERPLRKGEFWANKGISFELRRGECLGLIGHNGAGKTTLLKMLNGLVKPDTGRIEMRGSIGALIALGAGFNPILTGRENTYINGSVLGLSKKEVKEKIEEIIDFAEIREFIDSPVQTYSSGMQVRLGFAIAVILIQPDVLILDEVLAVGDMRFTIKCLDIVRRLSERSAVIFVSHNIQLIDHFCNRILLLEHGCIKMSTDNVSRGIECYMSDIEQRVETAGTGEATCVDEVLSTAEGGLHEPRSVARGDSLEISLNLRLAETVDKAKIRIALCDNAERPVASFLTINESESILQISAGNHLCRFKIGDLSLTPGRYHFVIAVIAQSPDRVCLRKSGMLTFNVSDTGSHGYVSAPFTLTAEATVCPI